MDLPGSTQVRAEQVPESDAALVRAAQGGDRQALERLLERHYPWLASLLTHLSRDPELARDLTQESMLAAARRLDGLRDAAAFRPWLYRIASNQLRSARRRQLLRQAVSLDEILARFPGRRELAAPDAHIERYGEREVARQVLDRLSVADRELLLLRHVAGFSGPEVAEFIGVTPDAARRRIARAVERFQRHHMLLRSSPACNMERERVA